LREFVFATGASLRQQIPQRDKREWAERMSVPSRRSPSIECLGLCYYGHSEPYKTVVIKADSLRQAMQEGRLQGQRSHVVGGSERR